jgi:VWFA-related protein
MASGGGAEVKGRIAAALCCLPIAATLGAQQPTFRAEVDAVEVDVSVTRGGRPVAGLVANNFVLTDRGTRQDVRSVLRSDLPLRVVLVLDASDSVKGRRLQRLIEAGGALHHALKPGDQLALITFSNHVQLRVPMGPPGPRLLEALSALEGSGPTSLYDALHLAIASEADQRVRSLILLFSDGSDTASWMPFEGLLTASRRSSSVVHIVRFAHEPILEDLARASGGRTFGAGSDDDLKELFTSALDEMRARYVLTYTPAGDAKKGWHDIKVSLKDARGDVTARPGYFVP